MLRRAPVPTRTDTLFPYTTRFRYRPPHASAAKARCGPVRAVCVRRAAHLIQIDSFPGRSVTPIFRGTANALGLHSGGIFVSAFAKEVWNKREIGRASCRERVCQYV